MIDFPRSLIEFQHGFPDERACAAYLADARWPDGFRCPSCGHDKGWQLSREAFTQECAACGKQTSVTAGTVRLAPIADFSAASLHTFIKANIAAGATAKTDGWSSYTGAPGVTHDPHVVLPWAHRVFANLKVGALGVYHGLREKHPQSYLDEFVFRFNRRRARHAAFRSLLGIAVVLKHVTYKMLI
jgi:ISXO2-like transposase domain/Transposase zinc-ribbon domain